MTAIALALLVGFALGVMATVYLCGWIVGRAKKKLERQVPTVPTVASPALAVWQLLEQEIGPGPIACLAPLWATGKAIITSERSEASQAKALVAMILTLDPMLRAIDNVSVPMKPKAEC